MSDDDDQPPPLEPARPQRAVDPPPPLEGEVARARDPAGGGAAAARPAAAPRGGAGGAGAMGLKKGFLSAGPSKPRRAAPAAQPAELEVLRARNPAPAGAGQLDARLAGLRIGEVQDALKGAGEQLAADKSWVTEGLLAQMQTDPVLRQGLGNPRFQGVIAELQANPQGVMERHKGDGELQAFILRFMQLMAAHLSALPPGGKSGPPPGGKGGPPLGVATRAAEPAALAPALSPQERASEELAQKALADPQLRKVLEDPDVQRVLQAVQGRDVAPVEQLMRRPDMVAKLQKLAGAGLLQMSWAR